MDPHSNYAPYVYGRMRGVNNSEKIPHTLKIKVQQITKNPLISLEIPKNAKENP